MWDNAQLSYQSAEALHTKKAFDEAAGDYEKAEKLYATRGEFSRAIECIIQRTVCQIEDKLQEVELVSNVLKDLGFYFTRMEKDIRDVAVAGELPKKQSLFIRYNGLIKAYRGLEKLYDKYGLSDEASEMFVRAMDYRRKLAWETSKTRWLFLSILKATCRYGESGWLLLIWGLGLILSFGTLYWGFELIDFSNGNAGTPGFWDSLYFSVVVLTTLGFGDISPNCLAGRAVVGVQVILGYTLLGIFISILASKVIRR